MTGLKNILVVDDERDCCDSLKSYFTKKRHKVDIAYDGLEASKLLENNTYDYIFFDCNMPELTGVELVKIIDQRNPLAKKIMISGYDLLNENFIKAIGVDLLLNKPVKIESVRDIINDSQAL